MTKVTQRTCFRPRFFTLLLLLLFSTRNTFGRLCVKSHVNNNNNKKKEGMGIHEYSGYRTFPRWLIILHRLRRR